MIRLLKGNIELIDSSFIIVDVQGVGYKVTVDKSVISKLHKGNAIEIFTYTHVKEDLLELYGFMNHSDLKLFEDMIGVSGIGPKTALGIFSLGTGANIINAIIDGNTNYFANVPRLGKKNAQKLIIELRTKLGNKEELDISSDQSSDQELLMSLKSLGFSPQEIGKAIKNITQDNLSLSEKVKLALKNLGK